MDTPEIYIRRIQVSDAAVSYVWRNNPNVTKHFLGDTYKGTVESEKLWIAHVLGDSSREAFAVCSQNSEKPIGYVQLFEISKAHKSASLSFVLGETSLWGNGIITKAVSLLINFAFDELALHRLESRVFASNPASIRVHEKLGFRWAGLLRDSIFRDVEFKDVLVFDLLRSDLKSLGLPR